MAERREFDPEDCTCDHEGCPPCDAHLKAWGLDPAANLDPSARLRASVPAMRELLDGYEHPDELPERHGAAADDGGAAIYTGPRAPWAAPTAAWISDFDDEDR